MRSRGWEAFIVLQLPLLLVLPLLLILNWCVSYLQHDHFTHYHKIKCHAWSLLNYYYRHFLLKLFVFLFLLFEHTNKNCLSCTREANLSVNLENNSIHKFTRSFLHCRKMSKILAVAESDERCFCFGESDSTTFFWCCHVVCSFWRQGQKLFNKSFIVTQII